MRPDVRDRLQSNWVDGSGWRLDHESVTGLILVEPTRIMGIYCAVFEMSPNNNNNNNNNNTLRAKPE